MPHENDHAELDELSPENLDAFRRSVAAIDAAYDGISADAKTIRDDPPGPATIVLIEAFSRRLAAFQLLLEAFEPLATMLSETYGRDALQKHIGRLGAQAEWSAKSARINADVERISVESTGAKETSEMLRALERRLTDLDVAAAELEREGHPGSRARLHEVLGYVRTKIQATDDYQALQMQMFARIVPAAELRFPSERPAQQPPPQQPAPQQPDTDPEEAAKLRAIQRAIEADARATTMKIFEIQRKAQQDAFDSMQRIHDKQNEMKF
jgi:hypothetical protein